MLSQCACGVLGADRKRVVYFRKYFFFFIIIMYISTNIQKEEQNDGRSIYKNNTNKIKQCLVGRSFFFSSSSHLLPLPCPLHHDENSTPPAMLKCACYQKKA